MSRDRLGGASIITAHVTAEFERTGWITRSSARVAGPEQLDILRGTFEAAGAEFMDENGGTVEVKLRKVGS